MFELTIDNTVYKFKFGIGFVREIDQREQVTQNGVTENAGLSVAIAHIIDGNVLALVDVLDLANKYAGEPRLTRKQIETYIEDENTDIDSLFESVMNFFGKSNATKKPTKAILEAIQAAKQ